MRQETAILAGGCFWGVQELTRRQPGVISSRVGYVGGETPHPTEDDPGDHAEAVEIVFDPLRGIFHNGSYLSSTRRPTRAASTA